MLTATNRYNADGWIGSSSSGSSSGSGSGSGNNHVTGNHTSNYNWASGGTSWFMSGSGSSSSSSGSGSSSGTLMSSSWADSGFGSSSGYSYDQTINGSGYYNSWMGQWYGGGPQAAGSVGAPRPAQGAAPQSGNAPETTATADSFSITVGVSVPIPGNHGVFNAGSKVNQQTTSPTLVDLGVSSSSISTTANSNAFEPR